MLLGPRPGRTRVRFFLSRRGFRWLGRNRLHLGRLHLDARPNSLNALGNEAVAFLEAGGDNHFGPHFLTDLDPPKLEQLADRAILLATCWQTRDMPQTLSGTMTGFLGIGN